MRHVEGVEWRRLCPTLDGDAVRSVHRQLAEALLALQTTTARCFGDLDEADPPGPADLPAALRRRADRLIADEALRVRFVALLDREADRLRDDSPTISHDDLHSGNVVLSPAADGRWRLAALLDWDKAWAGPAESDVARMALWDDMTGPGFWEVYRSAVPERDGWPRRAALHQLLWCLEYAAPTERHRADTAALWAALGGD
jgi:aminoglycoside phosphotransferase (APT) family kinase protein